MIAISNFNWFSAKTLFYEFIIPAKTSDYIKQRLNEEQSKELTSINILSQSLVLSLKTTNDKYDGLHNMNIPK